MLLGRSKLDYSMVTPNLFIGRAPRKYHFNELVDLGVTLVINMRIERRLSRVYFGKQLKSLWVPVFDSRFFPIHYSSLTPAVKKAVQEIGRGGKVYVGCRQGRHRSAVMSAAILIASGHSLESSLKLLKKARAVIDTDKPHINKAIREFANHWQK